MQNIYIQLIIVYNKQQSVITTTTVAIIIIKKRSSFFSSSFRFFLLLAWLGYGFRYRSIGCNAPQHTEQQRTKKKQFRKKRRKEQKEEANLKRKKKEQENSLEEEVEFNKYHILVQLKYISYHNHQGKFDKFCEIRKIAKLDSVFNQFQCQYNIYQQYTNQYIKQFRPRKINYTKRRKKQQ